MDIPREHMIMETTHVMNPELSPGILTIKKTPHVPRDVIWCEKSGSEV